LKKGQSSGTKRNPRGDQALVSGRAKEAREELQKRGACNQARRSQKGTPGEIFIDPAAGKRILSEEDAEKKSS